MQGALTRCPQCAAVLSFGDVTGVTEANVTHLLVGLACDHCGEASRVSVEKTVWRQLIGANGDIADRFKVAVQNSAATAVAKISEARSTNRQIGQKVKAFAMELETVLNLLDIEWIWDYQAMFEPETIEVEA